MIRRFYRDRAHSARSSASWHLLAWATCGVLYATGARSVAQDAKPIKLTTKADHTKFADTPDAELLEDVKAFLLKGAKDGDSPASCS